MFENWRKKKAQAQMSIIADLLALINYNIIIFYTHFIVAFCKYFFKQDYDVLKSVDKITKTTSCMSHNMVVESFSARAGIQRLKATI